MLDILIPTYKRNHNLVKLLNLIDKSNSAKNVTVRIRDNDAFNKLDFSGLLNISVSYIKNASNLGGRGNFKLLLEDFVNKSSNHFALFISDDDLPLSPTSILRIIELISVSRHCDSFQISSLSTRDGTLRSFNNSIYHYFRHFEVNPLVIDKCTVMTGFCVSKRLASLYLNISSSSKVMNNYPYPMQSIALLSSNHKVISEPHFIHIIENKTYWNYDSHEQSFIVDRLLLYQYMITNKLVYSRFTASVVASLFISRNFLPALLKYKINFFSHDFSLFSFVNPVLLGGIFIIQPFLRFLSATLIFFCSKVLSAKCN